MSNPMTPLIGKFCAVEIPEGKKVLKADDGNFYTYSGDGVVTGNRLPIPPGSYSLFCISDEVTEEQAGEIVEKEPRGGWVNYDADAYPFNNPKESLDTLLKHKGLNRCAILKIN